MPQTEQTESQIQALMARYQDGERHRLTADCEDWEQIIAPAMVAWGSLYPIHSDPLLHLLQVDLHHVLQVMIEAIYVMGYKRGKREAQMPVFIVAEQEEAQ